MATSMELSSPFAARVTRNNNNNSDESFGDIDLSDENWLLKDILSVGDQQEFKPAKPFNVAAQSTTPPAIAAIGNVLKAANVHNPRDAKDFMKFFASSDEVLEFARIVTSGVVYGFDFTKWDVDQALVAAQDSISNNLVAQKQGVVDLAFDTPYDASVTLKNLPNFAFIGFKDGTVQVQSLDNFKTYSISMDNLGAFSRGVMEAARGVSMIQRGRMYLHADYDDYLVRLTLAISNRFDAEFDEDAHTLKLVVRRDAGFPPSDNEHYKAKCAKFAQLFDKFVEGISPLNVIGRVPLVKHELSRLYYILWCNREAIQHHPMYKTVKAVIANAETIAKNFGLTLTESKLNELITSETHYLFDPEWDDLFDQMKIFLEDSRKFRSGPVDKYTHDATLGLFDSGKGFLPHTSAQDWGTVHRAWLLKQAEEFFPEQRPLSVVHIIGGQSDVTAECYHRDREARGKQDRLWFKVCVPARMYTGLDNILQFKHNNFILDLKEVFPAQPSDQLLVFLLDHSFGYEGVVPKDKEESSKVAALFQALPRDFNGVIICSMNWNRRAHFRNMIKDLHALQFGARIIRHPRRHNDSFFWIIGRRFYLDGPSFSDLEQIRIRAMVESLRINALRNHYSFFGWANSYTTPVDNVLIEAWCTLMRYKDILNAHKLEEIKKRADTNTKLLEQEQARLKLRQALEVSRTKDNNNNTSLDKRTPMET